MAGQSAWKARPTSRKAHDAPAGPCAFPQLLLLSDALRANGYEVNDRGRIPGEIREAFEAAN